MAMTRNPVEREKALAVVAEMYLRGKRQYEIAEALGVSQGTVSNDLKELRKRWLESSLRDFSEAKAQELAKIDDLERTYREAWEQSLQPERTDKLKGPDGGDADIILEREQITKSSSGNPAFLKGVMDCIDKRSKILGFDAPIKQELAGADGESLVAPDRLKEIASIIAGANES